MSRSSAVRLRSIAVALAGAACLVGSVTSARAAPAGAVQVAEHTYGDALLAEVRTFTGNGIGTSPSQAVDGAVRMAYTNAQSAGWRASQCYVRATDVKSVGGGVYAAVANLFCQR
ncbi:hypothetical protein [Streptomyces erythrochromogenes]|uniref:hypothetical protein n=1 Tax=Streptomyces erythrochromogenes TaxID=285574 RepID=UPI0022567F13|nr:hypothetical protein [Streptomyces erythrochromogenes]MCX5589213.1 hypothetical protein [Streptomyces erythrochromogenes]